MATKLKLDPKREEVRRTIDMISSDMNWPLMVLPLKQRRSDGGFPQLGYLLAPCKRGETVTIVLGCMYDKMDKPEVKNYRDVYAAVDDGWVVD